MVNWLGIIIVIIAGILSALIVPLVKGFTLNNNYWLLFFAIITSIVLLVAYILLFSGGDISSLYPIVKIIAILLIVGVGILLFKEPITWSKSIGVLLAIIALYLLS